MFIANSGALKTGGKSKRNPPLEKLVIPTSTPHCVIIKSCNAPLPKPIGTIKLKTQFGDDFPELLKGKIEESEFRNTIDGINWFANLLNEYEIEYFAEKHMLSESWKDFRQELVNEEIRKKKIVEILHAKGIDPIPFRERIKTEKELKEYQERCSTWIKEFINDENNRIYIHKGVQWYNPDKNFWRWIEIHVLPDDQEKPKVMLPAKPLPEAPVFGDSIEFRIDDTVEIGDRTEYLIMIKTDLKNWYPYTNHYVLRRYNEFKIFHKRIEEYMQTQKIEGELPKLPEKKVLGRKSKSTIAKRKEAFQEILNFIASNPRLNSCGIIFDFLQIYPDQDSWRYRHYIDCPIR